MQRKKHIAILSFLIICFLLSTQVVSSISINNSGSINYAELQKDIGLGGQDYELIINSGIGEFFIGIKCNPEALDEFTWEIIDNTNLQAFGYEEKTTEHLQDGRIMIIVRYTWLTPQPTGEIIIKVFKNNVKIKEVRAEAHVGIIDFIHPDIIFKTDKGTYSPDENIKIIVKNNGDLTYKIDSTTIRINTEVEEFAEYVKDIDELALSSGESKTILEWNQLDGEGNKAPNGRYSIYIEFFEDGVNYEQKDLGFLVSKARFVNKLSLLHQFFNRCLHSKCFLNL